MISDKKKLYFINKNNRETKKNINKNKEKIINKKTKISKIQKDPNSPFAVLEKLL